MRETLAKLHQERCLNRYLIARISYVSKPTLSENMKVSTRTGKIFGGLGITWCSWGGCAAILKRQSSCKHPSRSTWLSNTKPRRSMTCSRGQPSTSWPFSESAKSAPDRLPLSWTVSRLVPEVRTRRWIFFWSVHFTDEACVTRAETFNPHNFRDWQQDNTYAVHRFNYQHRFSVNGLAGIVGNYLIVPYLMPSPQSGESCGTFPWECSPIPKTPVQIGIYRA